MGLFLTAWGAEPVAEPFLLEGSTGKIATLAISQRGEFLAAAGKDRDQAGKPVLRVWDLKTCRLVVTIPTASESIRALAFSREAGAIVTGDDAGICRTYHVQSTRGTHQDLEKKISSQPLTFVAFEKYDPVIITGGDQFRIWNHREDRIAVQEPAHGGAGVVQAQQLIDFTFLVSCGGRQTGTIHPGTLRPMKTIGPLPYDPTCVAMTLKKNFAAVGMADGSLELWQPVPGFELGMIPAHRGGVTGVGFPDDETLVSAGRDGFIKFWDPNTGKQLNSIKAFTRPVVAMEICRLGPLVVATDGDTIKYWNLGPPESQPQPTTQEAPSTAHLNDLKNWTIKRGDWQQTGKSLIGSKDSQIVYKLPLPSDFTFQFKLKVHGDTRPRIRFGSFFVGDDTPDRVLFLHGTKATGQKFPHEREQEVALEVRIQNGEATLRINGKEVATANPKELEEHTLTLEGGGRQSTGSTEFYDLKLSYD